MIDFEYKTTEDTKFLIELYDDVNRIQHLIEGHLKEPVIELPLMLNEMRLDSIQAPCSNCTFPLIDIRGVAAHKFEILEIQLSGYCVECHQVSHPILRWYPDGHWCVCENGEWQQLIFLDPPTLWDKAVIKFRNFIEKFKKEK